MFSKFAAGCATFILMASTVYAQTAVSDDELNKFTTSQENRYSVVVIDGEALRVDRQTGTVSVCNKRNEAWRCSPVPVADDAYIAEINDLATQVDVLSARIKELENDAPPSSNSKKSEDKNESEPWLEIGREEDIDKMLEVTENAMKRFFSMVEGLRDDLEKPSE